MNRDNISGHMPEDPETPEYCLVRNFGTYPQKPHTRCKKLWPFPKDSFNISDECWFQKKTDRKGHIGIVYVDLLM